MDDAYAHSTDEVLKQFTVTEKLGLSLEQVKKNKEKYGLNGT